jgi:EAL domain-containing protein (putative c-di-GMP-specific phosphodiesterase class I)
MQWYLESLSDSDREWLINITSVPFVIGRADDSNLKLIDNRISRHHSEIHISGDFLWIRDLKSTNGTFVNNQKIEQAHLLEPNDFISFGKYKFRVKSISPSLSDADNETLYETLSEDLPDLDVSAFDPIFQELLSGRSVIPYFQPLLRLSDMTNVGYEILGRVADERLPSNPSELLDIAQCLGYGSELSSLFREIGVEIGKNLPGSPLLFVNSTRFEIHEMDKFLVSMKKIRNISPSSKVVLEINEKTAAETNDLNILRDTLGKIEIGLAFDDFGVGQTRLVELSNTPPDYLKFDISLVRKIHLAPKRLHQMISTFIQASHDLGILTLAEGVECSEEAQICKQLGFDLGQGYFFGRPAAIRELSR